MGETIELQDIFISTMAGAAVVTLGAAYALFFALSKLNNHRLSHWVSLACYGGLTMATFAMVNALALDGFWLFVVAVMLAGYFVAPRLIWHLCAATHGEHSSEQIG